MNTLETTPLHYVSLADNKRIPVFLHMLQAISAGEDANEVIAAYFDDLPALYPNAQDFMHIVVRDLRPGQFRIYRQLDDPKRGPGVRADLREVESSLRVYKGGLFAELSATPDPKIVHHLTIDRDTTTGLDLSRFHSLVAFPLYLEGHIAGWIVIFYPGAEEATETELEEIMVHGNLASTAAANSRIAQRLREATAAINREVEQIAEIQKALLPREMPVIPGLELGAAYETFDRAGGDYYDFIPLDRDAKTSEPRRWMFLIADASGHGPAAAVVIAMLHALLHSYTGVPESASSFLEYLNRNLQSQRIGGAFITAWVGIYEVATRTLSYASAGHEVPILMDRNGAGSLTRLEQPNGFPLGIWDEVGSGEATLTLKPAQTLVLYTDGIIEARSPEGHPFRVEGIEGALRTCNGEPRCVTLEVIDALRDHEAGARPRDDQTLVAIRAMA